MLGTVLKVSLWTLALVALLLLGLAAYGFWRVQSFDTVTPPEHHGGLDLELFPGEGSDRPLLVGFGGAEGGNAWASDRWQAQRERFLKQGYAFLAVGYFGAPGTPATLDRIALDAIHAAIGTAAADPRISNECVAVIGGSKGGELVLALASRYPDIDAVVAMVAPHAVFAAHNEAMTTSSFTDRGEPLPFVPVPWSATPALLSGDLHGAYSAMLEDEAGVRAAEIPVERIAGPVLLVSATGDELWPSTEMSQRVIDRLQRHDFPHRMEHVAIEGGHEAPLEHFDVVETFLQQNFRERCAQGAVALR